MAAYLVTGAAGFIGSAIAKRLVGSGHKVAVIDNLTTGFRDAVPAEAVFIEGDCQDESVYDRLPAWDYEAVFHVAGQSSGEISFDNPVYDLQTNAQSTLLLLRYALKVGCGRVVYASTMSVYGEQPDGPVTETASTYPKSFYGVGKLASENYLRIYSAQHGLRCTALRLFNVYGPGQNMENLRQGMVSIYLAQALRDRGIHVKGSSERFRDFIYIDDVVDAFLATAMNERSGYAVYNVATGVRTRVADVVEAIRRALPFEVAVRYEGSTAGDMFGIYGDTAMIENEIGWRARTDFAAGLGRMVAWARQET